MKWAALITWVVTAGGGFVLLSIWLARGGMRQQAGAGNRIRPPLIMSHFLLAASGLVLWIIYLAADKKALAWIAFACLRMSFLVGSSALCQSCTRCGASWLVRRVMIAASMFAIWLRQRRGRAGAIDAAPAAQPPEQHFPVAIVGLHGLLAATTLVLVLLTAIGVGGS